MNKERKMAYEALPQGTLIRATQALATASSFRLPEIRCARKPNAFGRAMLRALAMLAIGGAVGMLSGCLSVHVQHETDHPVVIPEDPPPPPPPPPPNP